MAYFSRRTPYRRALAALSGATLVSAYGIFGPVGLVAATPTPLDPTNPEIATEWVNPAIRPTDGKGPVTIDISAISMPGSNGTAVVPTDTVTLTVTIHNASDSDLHDIYTRVYRADPVATTALARTALAMDDTEFPYATNFRPQSITVPAGGSSSISIAFNPNDAGLAMLTPGVYPIMLGLSGTLGDQGARHLDSERFLLPVLAPQVQVQSTQESTEKTPDNSDHSSTATPTAAPAGSSTAADSTGAQAASTNTQSAAGTQSAASGAPLSLIWPLTARTNVLAGETGEAPQEQALYLSNDSLAGELRSGGRLYSLLNQYRVAIQQNPQLATASCIAIDPDLLNTINRMSGGYRVSTQRPNPVSEPKRLRDSWTTQVPKKNYEDGSGAEDAARWLATLRSVAAHSCVIALPWADAELGAVNRTSNQWLMREAIARGDSVIQQILGVEPVRNVVIPESGYVSSATASALTQGDTISMRNNNSTVESEWEDSQNTHASSNGGGDALNDSTLPQESLQASQSASTPVRVLVADNTITGNPATGPYARLYNGTIIGVSFQGSLAATLATVGPDPQTMGYSNPEARFDYGIDSPAARAQDASAALRLAVDNYNSGLNTNPVIVMPPHYLDGAEGSQSILSTISDLLSTGASHAQPLTDILNAAVSPEGPAADTGTQYSDPADMSDTEVLRAKQQANYTEDLTRLLTNDPQIALTRFAFTEPLMDDLLRSLTGVNRRSMATFLIATEDADTILNGNRDMLRNLRAAISLLPPGNVYTRTSANSPLLIVARNSLPLPVTATLGYSGPAGVSIRVPSNARIPARGSITLQMTADLPQDTSQTNVDLWLATSDGSQISSAVAITVQTRTGITKLSAVLFVAIAGVAAGVSRWISKRRKKARIGRHRKQA